MYGKVDVGKMLVTCLDAQVVGLLFLRSAHVLRGCTFSSYISIQNQTILMQSSASADDDLID